MVQYREFNVKVKLIGSLSSRFLYTISTIFFFKKTSPPKKKDNSVISHNHVVPNPFAIIITINFTNPKRYKPNKHCIL